MQRTLRIVTGLILFGFVTTHLINQALGLHSLALVDEWRDTIMLPWDNQIGGLVLIASLITHGLLGFASLYRRNTLKMSSMDWVQFVSGFLILPLLVPHVMAISMAIDLIPNYNPTYKGTLTYFWVQNPLEGLRQIFVVVIVWIHGAVGLLTYFRLQSWWPTFGPFINPLMVIVPVSALLGFVETGKEVIAANQGRVFGAPSEAIQNVLQTINTAQWSVITVYTILLVVVLITRYWRLRNITQITNVIYQHGPAISTPTGKTLLELSVENNVPHANLCRGRGRCGTCQVKVISSTHDLPPPSEIEQATLTRVGAASDVRLACQLIPVQDELRIKRLIPPYIEPKQIKEYLKKALHEGREKSPNSTITIASESEVA